MEKIKSAYEIAMERVNELDEEELSPAEGKMEKREKLKPILAKFYKGKIDSEGLWQELKEKDNELLIEAQLMLIESLGLRTTSDQFKSRKEGVLALETLKQKQNSSVLEQILNKISSLKQKYTREKEKIEEQLEQEMENNSELKMKPVQTEDGNTVMQMEPSLDEQTVKRYKNALSQLENRSTQMFEGLIEELKDNVE